MPFVSFNKLISCRRCLCLLPMCLIIALSPINLIYARNWDAMLDKLDKMDNEDKISFRAYLRKANGCSSKGRAEIKMV